MASRPLGPRVGKTLASALAAVLAAAFMGSAWADGGGDPAAGEAQSLACAACHGQDGSTPIDPTYPHLGGQNERYLFTQLQMVRDGQREILLMTGQLNGKSDQDLMDIAAYYASLPGKVNQTDAEDATLALGEQIYRAGIAEKGVAACIACHSPNGGGNRAAGYPNVSGQPSAYTVNQLTAYREGTRMT
ncbi:MAG: c-type cytochrome, partial [Pseudomonadota bacterium]